MNAFAYNKLLNYTSFVGHPAAEAYILRRKFVFFSILLVLLTFISYSQDHLPRMAVLPFNEINASKSDAEAITGLFETSFVNTGVYNVIEQAQMDEILTVHKFSLFNCAGSSKNS